MNDQVFVGLTTKSIDYAGCGLPLLNTISGDTWTLVEQYGAGFNITDPCSAADIISTMTNESFKKMRHGVSLMYQDHFSSEALMSRLGSALGSVVPARQTPPSEGPLNRTELLS